jgi:predicted RNA methylase
MATDIAAIIRNLHAFHDLTGRSIVSVGAGGGQLIDAWGPAASVIAVDSNRGALLALNQALELKPFRAKVRTVNADFLAVRDKADVVLFEFCLHEMDDPAAAIAHARRCAPDVLVLDHAEESEWAYLVAEEEKVRASSAAMRHAGIRKSRHYVGEQQFTTFEQLRVKVAGQGDIALRRIDEFRDSDEIRVAMAYTIALL